MATPPLGVIPIADPSSFYEPTVPAGGTGDVQWYSFTLTETHWVNIDTSPSTGPPDTELVLYDGAGNILAQNDDDPTSGLASSRIIAQLAAGTYYICVGMYEITALPDCDASSNTANVGGIALYVTFYPDPPASEEISLPHASSESLAVNPKWFKFALNAGDTLKGTAPGCLFLLYRQWGRNVWDDYDDLSYIATIGEPGSTDVFWLAVTQIGGGNTDWGNDFYVEPDGVYGGAPIDVTIYVDGSPPQPGVALTWYAKGADFLAWSAVEPSGIEDGWFPAQMIYGRVDNPGAGAVVWTHEWLPVDGTTSEPSVLYPKGPNPADISAGDVNWPNGVQVDPFPLSGAGHGELRLYCAIDGVPVAGFLWLVFSAGPQAYSTMAWGYDSGESETPAFWTDFKNTFEVV